jgi:hypothetical protein
VVVLAVELLLGAGLLGDHPAVGVDVIPVDVGKRLRELADQTRRVAVVAALGVDNLGKVSKFRPAMIPSTRFRILDKSGNDKYDSALRSSL